MTLALALTFCIIIFGEISGGHFNPAITVAMLMQEPTEDSLEKMEDVKLSLMVIVFQVVGGFIGAFVSLLMLPWNAEQLFKTRVLQIGFI